ncbi:Lambda-2 [Atlantic halibut reovirus]|nr:Lambda-2 [Atlantic halibut reovirus]
MATVFGIQLTNRLNTATVRRPFNPRRYDHYITTFTTHQGINQLFRAIDFDPTDHTATIIQTYPPLNAWSPLPSAYPSDLSLSAWRRWITERARSLATTLQRYFPLVANARRDVNPIVIGMILSAFLNGESITPFLSYLFYDPGVNTILSDLTAVDIQLSQSTFTLGKVLYTPAGLKYLALRYYDPSVPSAPCTFGKHLLSYATVAYYETDFARMNIIHHYSGGQLLLEHFDRPSYAKHVLIPTLGSPIGYGSTSPSQGDLLLAESLIDMFRQNASAGPSTAVARLDQVYHPIMNCHPRDMTLMSSRLLNLALIAVQGCQTVISYPTDMDMTDAGGFLSRLMSPGDPQLLVDYRADSKAIWRNSPFIIGDNPRYFLTRAVPRFVIGSTTTVPDAKMPLQLLPQYRDARVPKAGALQTYNTQRLSQIPIYHGHAISGGSYFISRNITGTPTIIWPVANLPGLPRHYFSTQSRASRELLSRLRQPGDRSLAKDLANFDFLSTLLNTFTNEAVLTEGFSMSYLGAASTHGDTHEPLILQKLRDGDVPGVPVPSKISQYGYDVETGAIMDTTLASPTGTFGLVYCDVDQVEDAGVQIDAANRAAIATMNTALFMTTAGGVTVVKVNFPTPYVWTQLFQQFPNFARELYVVKPLIVNSTEIFIIFVGRVNNGNLTCSPALHQFLIELYARSINLMSVMRHIPLLGESDDGTASLGFNGCRQYNPDLPTGGMSIDLQSLAYQLATVVPSTSYMSREDFDGASAITFYGKRTFLSARRLSRLQDINTPAAAAIIHQARLTGPPSFQLFPTSSASVTQLMTSCYNFMLEAALAEARPQSLIDCGTGPEARIISLVPRGTDLVMVDQRPPAEAILAFNRARVSYLMEDFTNVAFWQGRATEAITAIFSLGAAFAGNQVDLLTGLGSFMNSTRHSGAGHFWLQLNTPLSGLNDVDDFITVDTRKQVYSFNGGQRVEPYALPDAVLATIRATHPNATFSWLTPSPTLDWLEYVLGLGSSVSLDDIAIVRQYGLLTPILHVDLTQPPMNVPVPLVIGVQGVINVAAPNNATTVVGSISGVQVFTATIGANQSTLGTFAMVWNAARNAWNITVIPNQPGVLDVSVVDGLITLNRGSTNIAKPPNTLVLTFPPVIDFTNAGNDAPIVCHAFYRLGVFISVNGTYQPVNPERASIITVNANRVLHYVPDLSDNHVLMYICDVTDNAIGRSIAHPLAPIFTTVFPNNIPLLASPPYPGISGRLMLQGQPFLDLDPLPAVLPPGVTLQVLSTAIQNSRPTVLVPPGAYTYLVV